IPIQGCRLLFRPFPISRAMPLDDFRGRYKLFFLRRNLPAFTGALQQRRRTRDAAKDVKQCSIRWDLQIEIYETVYQHSNDPKGARKCDGTAHVGGPLSSFLPDLPKEGKQEPGDHCKSQDTRL